MNDDGLVSSNDTGITETTSYDLGSGPVTTQYDAIFNVNVTVSFPASTGQPDYNGLGGIIQTETGDLFFVMIDDDEGFGSNPYDDFPIESIVINSISVFGNQQVASATDTQSFVPCFVTGTRILTTGGLVAIQNLRPGDMVQTLDNGAQEVTWMGRRQLSADYLVKHPQLCAVHITAGALGEGYPARGLTVSPQHRVLLRSKIIQRMADTPEILVAAVKLVGLPGVRRVWSELGVQYHHFTCADHEVVWANGAPAETLFMGCQTVRALGARGREELGMIMPDAFLSKPVSQQTFARPVIQRQRFLTNMFRRHEKNAMELLGA